MKIITYALRKDDTGIPYLMREKSVTYSVCQKIKGSDDIAHMMDEVYQISELVQEQVYMIAMDESGSVKGVFLVSAGGMSESYIDLKLLFMQALLCAATQIILVHNHPSGSTEASTEDFRITKRIKSACEIMGVNLTDHIIIAGNKYYSFCEGKTL